MKKLYLSSIFCSLPEITTVTNLDVHVIDSTRDKHNLFNCHRRFKEPAILHHKQTIKQEHCTSHVLCKHSHGERASLANLKLTIGSLLACS